MTQNTEKLSYFKNPENLPDHSLGILAFYFASLRYPDRVPTSQQYEYFLDSFGTRNGLVHRVESGKYEVRIPIGETLFSKTSSDDFDQMGLPQVGKLLTEFGKPNDLIRFLKHLHSTLRRNDKEGKDQVLIKTNKKVIMKLSEGLTLVAEYNPSSLNNLRCWLVLDHAVAQELLKSTEQFDPKPIVKMEK